MRIREQRQFTEILQLTVKIIIIIKKTCRQKCVLGEIGFYIRQKSGRVGQGK